MGRKNTTSAVEARRNDVEEAMSLGLDAPRDRSNLARKWSVTRRQIERDVKWVRDRWAKESAGLDRESIRRRLTEHSKAVFRRALLDGSPKALQAANDALRFQADLNGLQEPLQIDVAVGLTPESVAAEALGALSDLADLLGIDVHELPQAHDSLLTVEIEK